MNFAIHVAPRYTSGSPAWVSRDMGMQVAIEEARAYERTLTGRYGEEAALEARVLGLHRIAYERLSVARGIATYRDILTNKTWTVRL